MKAELQERGILFVKTNRGGDITFHGPEQIVGYPILDLEKFGTDIGKYLRNLEEIIIRTLAEYSISGRKIQWGDRGLVRARKYREGKENCGFRSSMQPLDNDAWICF